MCKDLGLISSTEKRVGGRDREEGKRREGSIRKFIQLERVEIGLSSKESTGNSS
jgi:hypothetical protein